MPESDEEWLPEKQKPEKPPPKTCWEQRSALEFFKPVDKVTGEEKRLNKDGSGAPVSPSVRLTPCGGSREEAWAEAQEARPGGDATVPHAP